MRLRMRFVICCILIALIAPFRLLLRGAHPSGSSKQSTPNLKASQVIVGFEWIGEQIPYPPPAPGDDVSLLGPIMNYYEKAGYQIHGDTFPMTWAGDDEIYTSTGDPSWGGKNYGLDVEKFTGMPPNYTITRINPMNDYQGGGGLGTKPSGMICVRGVLYLAFQNLLGEKPPAYGTRSQHGDDATIVRSLDYGKTWSPKISQIKKPMFPGNRFGGPAFVNFGRDNANARDTYVYAVSTEQFDNGSHLRLGRVPADHILDEAAWEWVAELRPSTTPRWTKNLAEATPILSDDRHISLSDMVYLAPINRYLLLTFEFHKDLSYDDGTKLYIYDAPEPWGPFTLVHSEDQWESKEVNPYCPRLPLKWIQKTPDGVTGWLQFSGSWRPNSMQYRSHIRPFEIRVGRP